VPALWQDERPGTLCTPVSCTPVPREVNCTRQTPRSRENDRESYTVWKDSPWRQLN